MAEATADLRAPSPGADQPYLPKIERTWTGPPGFFGWFTRVNHKNMGLRFMVTSMVFFVLSGVLALLMRLQLAAPLEDILSPEAYN